MIRTPATTSKRTLLSKHTKTMMSILSYENTEESLLPHGNARLFERYVIRPAYASDIELIQISRAVDLR